MACIVKDNVVRLQISVNDVSLVEIFKGKQDLCSVNSSSIFVEPSLLSKYLTQVASWAEVHDEKQFGLRLEGAVESDNERVL